MGELADLRREYHRALLSRAMCRAVAGHLSIADKASSASVGVAESMVAAIGLPVSPASVSGQTAGQVLASCTVDYLSGAAKALGSLVPSGGFHFETEKPISGFVQYEHLAQVRAAVAADPQLRAWIGADYLVKTDVVVYRHPLSDQIINAERGVLVDGDDCASLTPMRAVNASRNAKWLHASVSCKWTIRSDRAQNSRTESLNLIRNRKDRAPHIMVVTFEPLPSRIESIALGTGDIDCTYHVALRELKSAVEAVGSIDQQERLESMLVGKRLRDISDLPFDLLT